MRLDSLPFLTNILSLRFGHLLDVSTFDLGLLGVGTFDLELLGVGTFC